MYSAAKRQGMKLGKIKTELSKSVAKTENFCFPCFGFFFFLFLPFFIFLWNHLKFKCTPYCCAVGLIILFSDGFFFTGTCTIGALSSSWLSLHGKPLSGLEGFFWVLFK